GSYTTALALSWAASWCIREPLLSLYFFFFQAEDGIRDGHVTGVQTCALPISARLCAPGAIDSPAFPGMVRREWPWGQGGKHGRRRGATPRNRHDRRDAAGNGTGRDDRNRRAPDTVNGDGGPASATGTFKPPVAHHRRDRRPHSSCHRLRDRRRRGGGRPGVAFRRGVVDLGQP